MPGTASTALAMISAQLQKLYDPSSEVSSLPVFRTDLTIVGMTPSKGASVRGSMNSALIPSLSRCPTALAISTVCGA